MFSEFQIHCNRDWADFLPLMNEHKIYIQVTGTAIRKQGTFPEKCKMERKKKLKRKQFTGFIIINYEHVKNV